MFICDAAPAQLSSATVMFSGGPLMETALTSGFTHLAEHMAFGQGLARTRRLAAAEDAGIELNGFTTKSYVAFTADSKCSTPSTMDCVHQLQDLRSRAQRPLPLLLNEYDDIQHEAVMVLTTPYEHAKELVLHHVFPGSSLANPILAELGLHKRMQNGAYHAFVDNLLDPAKAVYVLTGTDADLNKVKDALTPLCMPGTIPQIASFWNQPVIKLNPANFDNKIHTYSLPYVREPEIIFAFPVEHGPETDAALSLVPLLNRALAPFVSASLLVFNGASLLLCTGSGHSRSIGRKILQAFEQLADDLTPKCVSSAIRDVRNTLMAQGQTRKMGLLTSISAAHELLLMNSTVSPSTLADLDASLQPICKKLLDIWRETYLAVCIIPRNSANKHRASGTSVGSTNCSK